MTQYLVVSAVGSDKPGIINKLSEQALALNCNIVDTRMTVLGGEFALLMMVSGTADAIEALQPPLHDTAANLGLTLVVKPTQPRTLLDPSLPYQVSVIAMDNPGIVHEIAGFFGKKAINIEEMHTNTFAAAHTGTPMFSLDMQVYIPSRLPIGPLKEEFLEFCDSKNLDATIDAIRGNTP